MHKTALALGLILTALLTGTFSAAQSNPTPTRYLGFQVFSGSASPNIPIGDSGLQPLSAPPPKAVLKQFVQDIVSQIGSTGDQQHRLAFIIGPLSLDYTDAQLTQLIQDSFDVATELNVAVGFHIDDSMFWARRSDLWRDPKNVEWLSWDGTPNTGREIDWGPQPAKIAPQMCFNSAAVQTEVQRLAMQVIGKAIQAGVDRLTSQGRPDLFAGVIVGWETQISTDFDTHQLLGYCALSNLGYSQNNPPRDLDAEREQVVQSFIELWATGLKQAGVDDDKIYSHTALTSQTNYDSKTAAGLNYIEINHFAPPEVSFGADYHPGFSTYPQIGLMEQLYADFQAHGNPTWASAEGSIVDPATLQSGVDPETYLGWMFNHNATLVNLFGWGVGDKVTNPFWKAAASSDAMAAYRKFLSDQPLIEKTTDKQLNQGTLPDKIHQIQAALPAWLQKHPDQQSQMTALLDQLSNDVKAGDYQAAETIAEKVLTLIGQ